MRAYYKKRFALTEDGARGLMKATWAAFGTYVINLVPAMLLMLLCDELLLSHTRSPWVYVGIAGITLILMYVLLTLEYDKLYSATYQESADLRIGIAQKLGELPLSYFSKHDLSDISQTIMADVEGIEHAMSHSIPKVYGMFLFFPILALMMIAGNWKMGLAVILPTLISFVLIPLSKKIQVREFTKYYDVLRANSETFQETIELAREIVSFNLSGKVKSDLYRQMEASEKMHIKSEIGVILTMGLSNLFAYISLGVVVFVGVQLILKGEIDLLYLVGYLLAAMKIKDAVDISKEGIFEIFYLTPKIERIREIREASVQSGQEETLQTFDVAMDHVAFSYDEDTPVLNDVSFLAKQGEVTALVGASGSGKTSILRLVSRLYDYDKGKILIDGKDIKHISTQSLFHNISIVFQEVTLFNTSVMENIRIGRRDATDEEVKEAARLANCMGFINKLDKGFDTMIGENGAELSGGERQRLSIARAFLKDAPILILDEIAASLDVDNEKQIQESLNRLIQNKTVIIISHRMKSIENVDKIVVLEDGRVESEGSHEELMNISPIYRNLIEKTKMAEAFVY